MALGDLQAGSKPTYIQTRGTGKGSFGIELIRQSRARMGPSSMLVLLEAPKAVGYYVKISFTQHSSA